MKTLLARVSSIVVAAAGLAPAAAGSAVASVTETATGASAVTREVRSIPSATRAPVRIAAAATAPKGVSKKKKEPEIKGVEVSRGSRGFLGVEIVNGSFKITFYDEEKKPTKPDVDRAALRWDAKYKVGQERLVLNPDPDGKSLSNPKTIRPPYHFKLFIVLVRDATPTAEPVNETHVIDFRA